MPVKANKGEWGEPYAELNIIGTQKLYLADENGRQKKEEWMTVIDLLRKEAANRMVLYGYDDTNTMVDIRINGKYATSVPVKEFLKISAQLRNEIVNGRGASFAVSDNIMDFFRTIEMRSIKALSDNKNDVYLSLQDPRSSITRNHIGFSIKSKFGQNPTLFNTAPASAAVFKLTGMTDELAEEINSLTDSRGNTAVGLRCQKMNENGVQCEFVGFPVAKRAGRKTFEENLDLINPRLGSVIARALWNHFFQYDTNVDINQVINRIIRENPFKLSDPEIKYPYMMKTFLYSAYCGLTASTLWDGIAVVNGGFISVDENGVVAAHYALDSESFKSYLYNHCYFEFPSTAPNHGDYAYVFKYGDDYYFKLNFQIRYR